MAPQAYNRYQGDYGPNPGMSGGDPRGQTQNQIGYQQQRYESQQGPFANAAMYNYGRGSEADYGNYQNIMNQYMNIAGGPGSGGSSSGGGGGGFNAAGMYTPFTVSPGKASYSDPFNSYGGYQEFSKSGGYSPSDIANMRARGTAPVRASYANANRNIAQQRSLQGGYSPNAIATQARMAREQGQAGADAMQNVEAGLAQARQQGRLAGLGGMSGIETSRLGADVDLSKFNTGLDFQGQTYNADAQARAQAQNIGAAENAANRSTASAAQSNADRLRALGGATSLYGTTPGQSQLFGNQTLNAINQGGNFGMNMINATGNAGNQTGAYDQFMNRAQQGVNGVSQLLYPFLNNRQGGPQLPGQQIPNPTVPSYPTNDPRRRYSGVNYGDSGYEG